MDIIKNDNKEKRKQEKQLTYVEQLLYFCPSSQSFTSIDHLILTTVLEDACYYGLHLIDEKTIKNSLYYKTHVTQLNLCSEKNNTLKYLLLVKGKINICLQIKVKLWKKGNGSTEFNEVIPVGDMIKRSLAKI